MDANSSISVETQKPDVQLVYRNLIAGECCSLLGVGSVGKSNLLRHLLRDEVRSHFLGDNKDYLIIVLLDPHNLIRLDGDALKKAGPLWSGYELMLSRLSEAIKEHPLKTTPFIDTEVEEVTDDAGKSYERSVERHSTVELTVKQRHQMMFSQDSLIVQGGLRHLEIAVRTIMDQDERYKIAFLFDELDEFLHLAPQFFMSLRGLRDLFKYRLMYVTTSRSDLTQLAEQYYENTDIQEMLEHFTELFNESTSYIHLFDTRNILHLIESLAHRHRNSVELESHEIDLLLRLLQAVTGGHAGLIRRGFKPAIEYIRSTSAPDEQGLLQYLLANEGVKKECTIIFGSLTRDEQLVFYQALVEGFVQPKYMAQWQRLFDKHLVSVKGAENQPVFQIQILAMFVQTSPEIFI